VAALSTKTAKAGETFEATLASPVSAGGVVIAPTGSDVRGLIVNSDPGGRVKGKASLTLKISSFRTSDGQTVKVTTNPVVVDAKGTKKKDAARIGIGAGVGAAIGAIAGGGTGAAIGAGVGGAGGTALTLSTRGAAAELPAETVLSFALGGPLSVTESRPGSLAKNDSVPQ